MTLDYLKLLVLQTHEARSLTGRALERAFPEYSTIVVRVDGEETEWEVEDIDFDKLRVRAWRRHRKPAARARASFGVSDIVRMKP